MGWDGKFPGIDGVSFGPITGKGNMNLPEGEALARIAAEPGYREAFAEAFGDPAVTRPRIEAALGTFVRLLVSAPRSFDRWAAGDEDAVPEAAKRGFALFVGKANCAACHSGPAFSDGSFQDIGTSHDPGRWRLFPDSMRLRHAHKTPGCAGFPCGPRTCTTAPSVRLRPSSTSTTRAASPVPACRRTSAPRPVRDREGRPRRLPAQPRPGSPDVPAMATWRRRPRARDAVDRGK